MPIIRLSCTINAPISAVFDAARSIDLHQKTMRHTNEKAINGKTDGLIELGETVTWEAKHFGITQKLRVEITQMAPPFMFTDEMVTGAFKKFKHQHIFSEQDQMTRMQDIFDYTSPLGLLGKLADFIFLKKYMTKLLITRNLYLKEMLENAQSTI
jgi:ligand-binding SRPBCC domain-containing protein